MQISKTFYLSAIATILNLPLIQAEDDGVIVPFASALPACAAQCGPLFDAQGACSPPVQDTSNSCFCAYSTLQPFYTTSAGVCDAACPDDATGLTSIQQWFESFCSSTSTTTTAASGATSTSTSTSSSSSSSKSSGGNNGWLANHWKWVVMLIVLGLAFIFGWIGAFYLRKRIIRNREKQFEMRPPVAWGPHQTQGMSAGYSTDGGVVGAGRSDSMMTGGVVSNEKIAVTTNNNGNGGKKPRNWLKKIRQ